MHQGVIIGIHEGSVRGREYKKVQKPPIQDVLNPWEPLMSPEPVWARARYVGMRRSA